MIDPVGRLHNSAAAEATVSVEAKTQPPASHSFGTELSAMLAGPARSPARPVNLPVGQHPVAWRDPVATAGAPSQPSGLQGLVINFPAAAPATAAPPKQPQSFDDAYWASQPPAVRQLRNIQSQAQRTEVASQLSQQGYSIDVPIMVWGWDPATTTAARQAMGYTWVPAAQQQAVQVAPGVAFAGTGYNPARPPAGSIGV